MKQLLLILLFLVAPKLHAATPEEIARLIDRGELRTAETELRQILATRDVAAARQLLAVVLRRQNRPDEAAEQLEILAERFDSVGALLELARLEAGRGAPAKALDHLRRALELAPNSEEVLDATTRLALEASKPVLAIRVLEPLVRMHPSVADHAYLLGVAWMQAGDLTEAETALRDAIERRDAAPRTPETLRAEALDRTALGLVLNRQKRYAEARKVLEESLRRLPDDLETSAALAEALEGSNELEAAERRARRVLERDTDHPTALLVLGMVRMKEGRHEEATEALERVVADRPDLAKAHYQLSLAYARLGNAERSRHHRELYQNALDALEEGLAELRGVPVGDTP